jgi:hypothetical protein
MAIAIGGHCVLASCARDLLYCEKHKTRSKLVEGKSGSRVTVLVCVAPRL